jgi:hypothetical protein
MRFILTIIIHVCAHYLLRIASEDFGFITPRNGHYDEKRQRLEAGCFLKDVLFGNAWKEVSEYKFLMESGLWEKEIPIISEGDLVCLKSKGKNDNI